MQNVIVVGTIRKNRTELPAEFVSTKDRKESTTLYGYQKEAMIVSYCPKKRKVVTFLSTMHSDKGTESPAPDKKPLVITYYNAWKGGVDVMDQMVRWFTSKRKTRRWPMVIFYNMLDISALNSFIVWMSLNKENHAGKRSNRLGRSLLISLAKKRDGFQDEDTFKYRLLYLKIQESESAAPCVLQKPIAKQKPFAKPVAIVFEVITLSSFAESVMPNYLTVSHLFTFSYCHFRSLQPSVLE